MKITMEIQEDYSNMKVAQAVTELHIDLEDIEEIIGHLQLYVERTRELYKQLEQEQYRPDGSSIEDANLAAVELHRCNK